jgi:hypothetical protein
MSDRGIVFHHKYVLRLGLPHEAEAGGLGWIAVAQGDGKTIDGRITLDDANFDVMLLHERTV